MSDADAPAETAASATGRPGLDHLAATYRAPLVRYFLRRGLSSEAAEDCAHDVFLRIAQARPGEVQNPEAYLFKIAANVLIDRARRARARAEGRHETLEPKIPSPDGSPARLLEDREALKRLAAALDELPSRTREIFLMNRLEGLSYTQLAVRYHVSIKIIEREMGRALVHLRRRFPLNERR